MRTRAIAIASFGLTVTLLLTACGEPATRTGASAPSVSLVPATEGGPGPGHDVIDALAAATTDGPVQVATPARVDFSVPGAESRTLELLRSGKADVGVVRSGMLVAAGATSLRALQAPLVVGNDEKAAAIAADPVASTAMADLAKIGLVGLALVPGGLRHPVGYGDEPLLAAGDYRSAVIASAAGDAGAEAIVTALGATPDPSVGDERSAKVQQGQLRGIEISLHQTGAIDLPAVLTTNVTLYERFDVIVVRAALWNSLTASQQSALQSAADAVRISVPKEARATEQTLLAEWCGHPGAASATASAADLASLAVALGPVTASLESDGVARRIVERMRSLGPDTAETPPQLACGSPQAAPQQAGSDWKGLQPVGDQTVLDGTWRFAPTEEDLLAAGLSPSDARNNAVVWEVTLVDGAGTATVGGTGETCEWTFTFAGARVLFDFLDGTACGGITAGTYTLSGDVVDFDWTDADDPYALLLFNGIFGTAVRVTG